MINFRGLFNNGVREGPEKVFNEIVKMCIEKNIVKTKRYIIDFTDIYVKTYDELQNNEKYIEAYELCYDIADQHLNKKKDKIVSVVDEESEIILAPSPGGCENIKYPHKGGIALKFILII